MPNCEDCSAPAVGQFDIVHRNTPGPNGEDRTVLVRGRWLCEADINRCPGDTFPMAPPPPGNA